MLLVELFGIVFNYLASHTWMRKGYSKRIDRRRIHDDAYREDVVLYYIFKTYFIDWRTS